MKSYKKIRFIAIILSILIPILLVLFIIGFHSNELIIKSIHYVLFLFLFLGVAFFEISIILMVRFKDKIKLSKIKKAIYIVFISLELIGTSSFLFLMYGPISSFREWLISSAMTTMNHRYLATWFYNSTEIDFVLEENKIIELDENTNLDLIHIKNKFNSGPYANEYEEAIFTVEDENIVYKIIPVSGKGYKGYLAVIYDPSRIFVATTKYLGSTGQYVTEMASDHQAIIGINGGGFLDPNRKGTGGTPGGVLIKNGKIISDKSFDMSGGLIGITTDNKLFLGKVRASEAIQKGVRDGVSFGPFLIVNGKKSFTKGNGGWGYAPRTAIGQRQDGIILLLVVDGRTIKYPGASLVDLMNILYNYGAYNAANLDGGTSSVMVLPQEEAKKYITDKEIKSHCKKGYCYINDIVNGSGAHTTRPIASSFLVK